MEAEAFTSREDIDRLQVERLPSLAARVNLHLRPEQALQEATMQDAIELSAADVVESGRDFAELSDEERSAILTTNYTHCLARNVRYLHMLETQN